jgi:hypothetical protein
MKRFEARALIAMSFSLAVTSSGSVKSPAAGSGISPAEMSWKP